MANKLDDHNEKFSFMEEYFKLTEVLLKDNGVIDYSFTCIKCLPTKKTIKTNSQAPTSNLSNLPDRFFKNLSGKVWCSTLYDIVSVFISSQG